MAFDLNMNVTNSVAKGTVIYEKGDPIQSVALILKGRVVIQTEGVRMTLNSGNFLGMCDMEGKTHSFTYTALDDTVLYALPITNWEQACHLLDEKEQYRGLLITSLNFFILELYKNFGILSQEAENIAVFVQDMYSSYIMRAEEAGLVPEPLASVERLNEQKPDEFALPSKMEYHIQCSRIPVEIQKNFFGSNAYVAKQQYADQCQVIPVLIEGSRYFAEWINRVFRALIMDEKNLYAAVGKMALNVRQAGQDGKELSALLDRLLEKINATEKLLTDTAGVATNLNRSRMEQIYYALLSDDTGNIAAYERADVDMLNGSLMQILDYAPVYAPVKAEFSEAVEDFLRLTDKYTRTADATKVRKSISAKFFEIYEAVAKKSFADANPPLAVKLFLRFGYVSEELLTADELRMLLSLPETDNDNLDCKVYTMAEWLREIYEGRKNPSKDEFDTDYEEYLRKQVSEKKMEKKDVGAAFRDPDARLHYEVDKLMRYADRVISGSISTFAPILCSEGIFSRMENSVVTGAMINTAVRKIEKVDYSIFYRERFTAYEEVEIPHFTNVERYTPDFILFPVYGRNSVMWQDIEGRRKDTHGRILLPALLEQNLEGEIGRMLAHFRWEKCRTDMGANWNNYRYPSLTSEYTDYLQFYKKNNELSPERKEKLKTQLQSCNNRHRDVFAKDYLDWVLREAAGAMKLNRVAREILYTYCPFASEFAKPLLLQNSYQEAAKRYMSEYHKQEKTFTVIERKFEKNGLPLPEEILRTKEFLTNT